MTSNSKRQLNSSLNSTLNDRLHEDLVALEQETANGDLFRLAQARNSALQNSSGKLRKTLWPLWATSLASMVLVGVFVLQPQPLQHSDSPPLGNADTNNTVLEFSEENLDLYEDLDFYDWLADIET